MRNLYSNEDSPSFRIRRRVRIMQVEAVMQTPNRIWFRMLRELKLEVSSELGFEIGNNVK